jgi:adenylate cyclase
MSIKSQKRNTILNLYNSGINPEIIALELDTSKDKVMQIIHEEEAGKVEINNGTSLKSKSKTENRLINKAIS